MTQSLSGSIETISHQVDRLTIQIDDSFDGFRNRYERAVPEFHSDRFDFSSRGPSTGRPFRMPPQRSRHMTLFSTGPTTLRR